jgi:hypothetical protein
MFDIEFGSKLIKEFFIELEKEKIDYIVLRNYEGLPEKNSSKDVDILIDENNINLAHNLLLRIAEKLEYNFIWKNKLDYLSGYAFVKVIDNIVYSVKIDLFYNLKWRGLYYIDNKIIFDKKELYNSLYVPNKSHESFIMILYYVLYAKNIKKKYFNNIFLYKNDVKNFNEISILTLGRNLADSIVSSLDKKDIPRIVTFRQQIVYLVIKNNVKKLPLMVSNIFRHLYYEFLKRSFFGTVIVFKNNCPEKYFLETMFSDLGIGYEKKESKKFYNISIFKFFKLLRKNPLLLVKEDELTSLQKNIFAQRIIYIKNNKLIDIFSNIEKIIKIEGQQ